MSDNIEPIRNGSDKDLIILNWCILMFMLTFLLPVIDAFVMLSCDYLIVIIELLDWIDFYVGCSLKRFNWDQRSIYFLVNLICLLDCLSGIVLLDLTPCFYTYVGFEPDITWLLFFSLSPFLRLIERFERLFLVIQMVSFSFYLCFVIFKKQRLRLVLIS